MERTNVQKREMTFEPGDLATRGVDDPIPVVISSDAVVEVQDGPEILVHTPDAVDLRRAPLPIIATHNSNQVNVGLVSDLRLENGVMRGNARFGKRPEAAGYREDVLAGIVRSVSVAYSRLKAKLRADGVLVTYRWMPSHVALVAEPADINAGFFRAAAPSEPWLESEDQKEVEAAREQIRAGLQPAAPAAFIGVSQMADEKTQAAGQQAATQYVSVTSNMPEGFDPLAADSARTAAIRNMARGMQINDERTIQHWIQSGATYNQITDDALAIQKKRGEEIVAAGIGLTQRERTRFSISRMINAVASKNYKDAGFEVEVSKATAQRANKLLTDTTFMLPTDITHARASIVGTGSLGGFLVGTDIGSFIDILRNQSRAFQAGVQTMSGLVGVLSMPKKASGAAGAWLTETGTATANDFTLSQVNVSPKRFAAYTEYSKQLMLQATPDIDMLIQQDLAGELAVKIDLGILWGTGANNPTGIRYTSGIGTANPTAGTAVNYADMIKFQSTVAAQNALISGFTYLTTPGVAGMLMAKFTNGTYGSIPVWNGGIDEGLVVGKRALTTQQIGSGQMLAGCFNQAWWCEWAGIEIEVNPYAGFQTDVLGVKATVYGDVAVRYPQAFAVGTGMTG